MNLGTNSSLSTSATPAQLVDSQVNETQQCAAQYLAQPHKDESEYSPDDWVSYMCTLKEADFAQANPMLHCWHSTSRENGANAVEAEQGEKARAQ